jgi:hypothetical protein
MRCQLILLVALLAATPIAAQDGNNQADSATSGGAKISPERREMVRHVVKACRADIRSLCAGVQRGGGRIAQCLRANSDKLSQPCSASLQQARAAHDAQN